MDRHLPAAEQAEDAEYQHLRAAPRDSMFLMAMMRRPHGPEVPIKVRNLSAGGLMAECPMSFSRAEVIEIELRGIGLVGGRIAWAAGGRIGVSFDQEVDPRLARKPVAPTGPQQQLVKTAHSNWRAGLK